jgi:biotin transporter BioY
MFKWFLISIVVGPVAAGVVAARVRQRRSALVLVLALVLAYDVCYLLLFYYLRMRWVG